MAVYFIAGANRGIGLALAKQLSLLPDVKVFASARNPDKATELNEWTKTHPNVHVVKLDTSSESSIVEVEQEVAKLTDGIDVLIVNAAIADTFYNVVDAPANIWLEHYKVNTLGPTLVFKSFYPLLKNHATRKAIFISSTGGSMANFGAAHFSPYGQSKVALNFMVRALSVELDPEEFTVVAVHPGEVSSDMLKASLDKVSKIMPDQIENLKAGIITPDQSAEALTKLITGISRRDNGKFLKNDGTEIPW